MGRASSIYGETNGGYSKEVLIPIAIIKKTVMAVVLALLVAV